MIHKVTRTVFAERRILRLPAVEQKTGFKRAHIYGLIRDGKFPPGVRVGVRAVGWESTEVSQWVAERLKKAAHAPQR